jgi:hypothetical protein
MLTDGPATLPPLSHAVLHLAREYPEMWTSMPPTKLEELVKAGVPAGGDRKTRNAHRR